MHWVALVADEALQQNTPNCFPFDHIGYQKVDPHQAKTDPCPLVKANDNDYYLPSTLPLRLDQISSHRY